MVFLHHYHHQPIEVHYDISPMSAIAPFSQPDASTSTRSLLQIASPPSRGTSNSTFSDARSPLLGRSLSLFTVLSVSVCESLTDLKNFSASRNVQSSPLCNFNKVIIKKCIGEEIYPEVYLLLFFISIQLTSYSYYWMRWVFRRTHLDSLYQIKYCRPQFTLNARIKTINVLEANLTLNATKYGT